ncbi:hypothetical protein [Alkalihalobacillus sp. LMS39]|uniref:hypothetical protein n=1 Tax=Alkalihalobacillus sp. LMS39 TaxID=2924032 RepID=UPI001FB1ADE7|nr:hypothetical protein [Alkalihalobacillus sp. LMS39]UOE96091.1 hypothetical protein MM271_11025 [Alkalihalobacillus sp. LMS39]
MLQRLLFFLLGTFFLLASLPVSSEIIRELNSNKTISENYEITTLYEGDEYADLTTYYFRGHIIEIEEVLKEEEIYRDTHDYKIGIADLSLKINGEEVETLKDHPIRTDSFGLSRYFGEVAFLVLEDKKSYKTEFVVLLKKTKVFLKAKPNGDLDGWVPIEELNYSMITLDEEGNITNTYFNMTERDALQTQLLNQGTVVPYYIGYHNDYLAGYPSLFFPIAFPFGTLIIGFILIMVGFLIRKKKNVVS